MGDRQSKRSTAPANTALTRRDVKEHEMKNIFHGVRSRIFIATIGVAAGIVQGGPNSVYVMAVEDGADIAGMGGLMGTAMQARNFSGAVVDGGVRDTAYLQKIGFPVFALGTVPSTSVGHYRFAGANN